MSTAQVNTPQELHVEFMNVFGHQVKLIQAAENWHADVTARCGVSKRDALALETLVPGVLASTPLAGYTESPSRTNFDIALESAENIITKAAKAIIEAFLTFVRRAADWVKAKFEGKAGDEIDPDEVVKTIQVKATHTDFYGYVDKYPEVVEAYVKSKNVNLDDYKHLAGGKLLQKVIEDQMVNGLKSNSLTLIRAIVDDGFVIVKSSQIQHVIRSFNVYLNALQGKIKEYNLDVPMNQNQASAIDKSLDALWMQHLHVTPENLHKLLVMIQDSTKASGKPDEDAAYVAQNIAKFYQFYNKQACLEMKKYSMSDIQMQSDALGKKAQTNQSLLPAITSVQHALRLAMMGMHIVNDISINCALFNKRYVKEVRKTYVAQLEVLGKIKDSPRAEPSDINGMKRSEDGLKAEIDRLEKLLK